jgi:hypothetical protein
MNSTESSTRDGSIENSGFELQGLIATGFRGAKTLVKSSLLPKKPE